MINNNTMLARVDAPTALARLLALLGTAFHKVLGSLNATAAPGLELSLQEFPYYLDEAEVKVIDVVGIALFPFALSFLIPVYTHTLVLEKQEKLRGMMRLKGLRRSTYWTVAYGLDYVVYLAIVLLFIGVELASGVKVFTETAPHITALTFVLWGFAQLSFAYFLSAFLNSTRTATSRFYSQAQMMCVSEAPLTFFLSSHKLLPHCGVCGECRDPECSW
jgi:hypothetical protein